MSESIPMINGKSSTDAKAYSPGGGSEVLTRLSERGGTVTTAAPGPTHLVRQLWKDNAIRPSDDRVQWCVALIRDKRIKCSLREGGASATYSVAPPEELTELS